MIRAAAVGAGGGVGGGGGAGWGFDNSYTFRARVAAVCGTMGFNHPWAERVNGGEERERERAVPRVEQGERTVRRVVLVTPHRWRRWASAGCD